MTTIESVSLVILALIVIQTSYLVYASWRGTTRTSRKSLIFVDTSVLMDGRILPLASTGFILGTLVVPRSVVRELQLLADKADTEKRERARRGLDVVNKLQAMDEVSVELMQDNRLIPEGVDERLLELAKKYNGSICTIDFNLNKVAQVEGITILNINELAQQLRMSYLPGDKVTLQLTQPGSDSHQAVGHLEDGTMVVVEQSKKFIGDTVSVEIIRSLQTAAGKMMFAKLADQPKKDTPKPKAASQGRKPAPKAAPIPKAAPASKDTPVARPATANSGNNRKRSTQLKAAHAKPANKRRQDREDKLIELINKQ